MLGTSCFVRAPEMADAVVARRLRRSPDLNWSSNAAFRLRVTTSFREGWRLSGKGSRRMTSRLLSSCIREEPASQSWVSLLRSCGAHEAYLRTYRRAVDADRVAEFLLLDRLFPRSVYWALTVAEQSLRDLDTDAVAQDQCQNRTRRGPERDADADLERAPGHHVADHRIQARGCQNQGHRGEGREQDRQDANRRDRGVAFVLDLKP